MNKYINIFLKIDSRDTKVEIVMAVVVVKVVRKSRILRFAGGFDIDCERKGGVKGDSTVLWLEQPQDGVTD